MRQYMSELSRFLFYVLDIDIVNNAYRKCSWGEKASPSLNAAMIDIALVLTLVRTSRRANPILICDVICRQHL